MATRLFGRTMPSYALRSRPPLAISVYSRPRGAAVRTIILLVMISTQVSANDGESGIFLIQTKDFRGFQYGNPASRLPQIQADLFADKAHLHFVFPEKKCAGFISQPEIN